MIRQKEINSVYLKSHYHRYWKSHFAVLNLILGE